MSVIRLSQAIIAVAGLLLSFAATAVADMYCVQPRLAS
jgi:hypothetical protein